MYLLSNGPDMQSHLVRAKATMLTRFRDRYYLVWFSKVSNTIAVTFCDLPRDAYASFCALPKPNVETKFILSLVPIRCGACGPAVRTDQRRFKIQDAECTTTSGQNPWSCHSVTNCNFPCDSLAWCISRSSAWMMSTQNILNITSTSSHAHPYPSLDFSLYLYLTG